MAPGTMQAAKFAAVLVLCALASRSSAVVVSSCEEFAAVDRKTETEVTITNADFTCTEYTRLSIKSPSMALKSSVGAVTFSNLALSVYGALTVEPDVEFTGIELVEKNGGALKMNLLSSAVFEGTAKFTSVSIQTTDLGLDGELKRKGAAIHNKGELVFMKDVTFTGCLNDRMEYGSGPGGAVSNHVKGSINFMGNLIMVDNEAEDYFGDALGGSIYNRGDIVVDGDAEFIGSKGGSGGAIFQEKHATFSVYGFATFNESKCFDTTGGAIANIGGDMFFYGGSLFYDNFAENSGDGGYGGGIYNSFGANIVLEGPTTFLANRAHWGGAIMNVETQSGRYADDDEEEFAVPTITFPDDAVFIGNSANICPDFAIGLDKDICGP